MGRQTEEAVILNLLAELQKDEIFTRNEAIKAIIKNKVNDPRIVDALIHITGHDSSKSVRNFARSALDQLGVEHSEVEEDEPVVTAHKQEIRSAKSLRKTGNGSNKKVNSISPEDAKKRRDFWDGFGVWFGLNIAVLIVMSLLSSLAASLGNGEFVNVVGPVLLWLIPLAINVGVMIYYGTHNHPQAVIGMLAAFGSLLVIGLCLSAACFLSF